VFFQLIDEQMKVNGNRVSRGFDLIEVGMGDLSLAQFSDVFWSFPKSFNRPRRYLAL
jgi:hypothetical protein